EASSASEYPMLQEASCGAVLEPQQPALPKETPQYQLRTSSLTSVLRGAVIPVLSSSAAGACRFITERRLRRQLIYSAEYGTMNELMAYLTENCCGRGACSPVCNPMDTFAKEER